MAAVYAGHKVTAGSDCRGPVDGALSRPWGTASDRSACLIGPAVNVAGVMVGLIGRCSTRGRPEEIEGCVEAPRERRINY